MYVYIHMKYVHIHIFQILKLELTFVFPSPSHHQTLTSDSPCSPSNSYLKMPNCYCIHACLCTYSLFGPYNATCMYVFRAGCLALDSKLACTSLGRPPLLLPMLLVGFVGFSLSRLACSLVSWPVSRHVGEPFRGLLLIRLGDTASEHTS